jgi:enoyl-CoA hydratase / 3-hydroxyacyl-CoA dehydrogenase
MNTYGIPRAAALVRQFAERWRVAVPETIATHERTGEPFRFTLVTTETESGVATLTINRPDALNALNEQVVDQLGAAFHAAEADPAVRGIAIAGSGKAFIAGADIRFFVKNIEAKNLQAIAAFTKRTQDLLLAIERCRKPVVALVRGLALGGGVEVALACHSIVATPRASFAFPETGIGIYPGLGGTQRTTRRVGTALAKWLVLSGQSIGAGEALAIGLIDRIAPPEQLDDAVRACIVNGPIRSRTPIPVPESHRELAAFFGGIAAADLGNLSGDAIEDPRTASAVRRMRGHAPIAMRLALDLIDRGETLSIEEGLALELSHLEEIFSTADAREGLSSVGRRAPVFKGA